MKVLGHLVGAHDDPQPVIEIELLDDADAVRHITALIDTSYDGELYLGAKEMAWIRTSPVRHAQSWKHEGYAPLSAAAMPKMRPLWGGRIRLGRRLLQVAVQEGWRQDGDRPRVGRRFLARAGLVLVLDMERRELQVLPRVCAED